jgi:diguanylate cyclase (GGDEF)-like protein/PAS domain S-box-containing protein
MDSSQRHDSMEQEQRRASRVVENRIWTHWSLLVGVAITTTVGLATAMAALLKAHQIDLWPWAKTEHVLLIGISLLVVVFAFYLTRVQKQATETHKRYMLLQSQVALQESEFRFNAVLNTVGEGIITVDDGMEIVMANREASRIWDCPRRELIGIDVLSLIHEHDSGCHFREILELCESNSDSVLGQRYQLTGLRKGGTRFPLEMSITRTAVHGMQHFTLAARDISKRVQAQERIRDLAFYDSLTGLPNREFFCLILQNALASATLHGRMVGLLFLDLDGFKKVNDTFGHAAGDQLLIVVAKRLLGCVRTSDIVSGPNPSRDGRTVSRLGGDEFTILLTGISGAEDAAKVCRRVQNALSRPITLNGTDVAVGSSIGIAVFPGDGKDVDTLLKNADAAMYSVKARSRNQYAFCVESIEIPVPKDRYIAPVYPQSDCFGFLNGGGAR